MTIKKLLVLSIFIYLVIFLCQASLADNKAYVYVKIADAPPRILGIAVKPDIAYADSEISCEADIWDENLSLLKTSYEWRINDNAVYNGENGKYLHAILQPGDIVTCKITAIDIFEHVSEAISNARKIQPSQPSNFLQATGYAVRDAINTPKNQGTAGIFLLSILLIALGFRRFKRFNKQVKQLQ